MSERRAREIASAVVASASIPLATNGFDHVKTRMQARPLAGASHLAYTGGMAATARRMLAEEGTVCLWSTGMTVSVMREASTQYFRFGAYPLIRDLISRAFGGGGAADSAVGVKMAAGLLGGAASGLAASPFDLVRIRLQAEAGRLSADGRTLESGLRAGSAHRLTSTWRAFSLVAADGVGVLWRGAGVNVLRAALMNLGTVPVYEHTKHLARTRLGASDTPSLHLAAGIVAGLVGTTVTAPADVLRTRIMAADGGGLGGAVRAILRDAGPIGFFRGWVPFYMRIGPIVAFYPARALASTAPDLCLPPGGCAPDDETLMRRPRACRSQSSSRCAHASSASVASSDLRSAAAAEGAPRRLPWLAVVVRSCCAHRARPPGRVGACRPAAARCPGHRLIVPVARVGRRGSGGRAGAALVPARYISAFRIA